ncbi:DivIVA domain-containing protein [Blastococcus sp. PRF04-17]|uniref:DivIVA domain-containing protein n=1 Tax=Blastococcus sp. PRF04-17 TaxID=2933797 RepID=UPI001FF34615|nr:DivIVA domain-containing protein [Blastococcus sp. PRF04-17]UOY02382.1 DivIVA domain-containing protein [Blastococcus sp. PRF04-17]
MTTGQNSQVQPERRLSPADLHNARFTRAPMLRPGYVDSEVDRVMSRVAEEIGRLIAEKAELRDQVTALQMQVEGHQAQLPPSDQAVRILASAQLTADNYVAEAEEFSRQVTAEARTQYEELTREARETAGAIIQAAQQAAATMTPAPVEAGERDLEKLQEQVAYLKAFGQACRVQLRSYLEALLSDIETEWGRADPAALPEVPRPPAQRSVEAAVATTFEANTAAEHPMDDGDGDAVVPARGATSAT